MENKRVSKFVDQLNVVVLKVRIVRSDQTSLSVDAKCCVENWVRVVEFIFDFLVCL